MVYCAWISTPQTHNKNKQNWDLWQDVWVVPCTSPSLKMRHLTVDGLRALTSLNTDEAPPLSPATENWSLSEVATVQCSEGGNDKDLTITGIGSEPESHRNPPRKMGDFLQVCQKSYGWLHVRNTAVHCIHMDNTWALRSRPGRPLQLMRRKMGVSSYSWKIHLTIRCSESYNQM